MGEKMEEKNLNRRKKIESLDVRVIKETYIEG